MLTRLGNKQALKDTLYQYFPPHKMRIEFFFGAGGSFFNLPKPQYAILNDYDDDVFNLYQVLLSQKSELREAIEMMPISQSLLNYWKTNLETDPLKKSIRFLLMSNFTYLGKGDTIRFGISNSKKVLLSKIEKTFRALENVQLMNEDFRDVLPKVSFPRRVLNKTQVFGYLDPVYLDTIHSYKVPSWTVNDTEDCFKLMAETEIKCAMSESDHEAVLDFASDYKMQVQKVTERKNLKNRRIEILAMNYKRNSLF
jgi:DNA adenine methylase